jgi:hypothetical protein
MGSTPTEANHRSDAETPIFEVMDAFIEISSPCKSRARVSEKYRERDWETRRKWRRKAVGRRNAVGRKSTVIVCRRKAVIVGGKGTGRRRDKG